MVDAAAELPSEAERELTEAEKAICADATTDLAEQMCDIFGEYNLSPHMAMAVIGNAAGQLIDAFPQASSDEKAFAAEVVRSSIDATLRGLAAAAGTGGSA